MSPSHAGSCAFGFIGFGGKIEGQNFVTEVSDDALALGNALGGVRACRFARDGTRGH
jgi:hypothetical protein